MAKRKTFDKIEKSELDVYFDELEGKVADRKSIKALEFKEFEDGWSVTANRHKIQKVTDLVIPAFYKGKPVLNVFVNAFSHCLNLESVTFERGSVVKSVHHYAFCGCSNLTKVSLPDSIDIIYDDVFKDCNKLSAIKIPFVGKERNSTKENFLGYLFSGNNYQKNDNVVPITLKTVIVSGGEKIPNNAFYGCADINKIIIGDGVTSIGNDAFNGCTSLEEIVMPKSVESIGSRAFSGCAKLKNIVIPESVTSIGSLVFENCNGLTAITIPFNVQKIGFGAFAHCKNLAYADFEDPEDWFVSTRSQMTKAEGVLRKDLANTAIASNLLRAQHSAKYWAKIANKDVLTDEDTETEEF